MEQIKIKSKQKDQVIDITHQVQNILDKQDLEEGLCNVFVSHTTCCITTADLDPGTDKDLLEACRAVIPDLDYRHPHNPEHTPDHILSSIIGPNVTIPFENKKLILGTWQRIILVEFNGPRDRDVFINLL